MEKMLAIMLLMSLMTVSCGKSGGGSSSEESTQTIIENGITDGKDNNVEIPYTSTPPQALSFKTNVDYLTSFTATQEDKYNEAVAIVKKVIATEAFKTKVLGHIFNGSKQYANNRGRTNAQIYQSILDAAETLQPTKNNTMDVGVKLYYANDSIVGYTNGSITYINVNTKFFNGFEANEVAGNLFHEWLHKLGYGHDASATSQRPYSVPYAIGYIVRNLGKNFL